MRRCSIVIMSLVLSLGIASCVADEDLESLDADELGEVEDGEELDDTASEELIRDQMPGKKGVVAEPEGSHAEEASGVCGGLCRYDSNWAWQTCRYNVTVNCRDRVVEFCHNRGWGFIDASWTGGCWEGWVRLWPI